jgi:hypothetical protein
MALQRLQDTDLLRDILERQQRMAEERFGDSAESDAADTIQSSAAQQRRPASDSLNGASSNTASR